MIKNEAFNFACLLDSIVCLWHSIKKHYNIYMIGFIGQRNSFIDISIEKVENKNARILIDRPMDDFCFIDIMFVHTFTRRIFGMLNK